MQTSTRRPRQRTGSRGLVYAALAASGLISGCEQPADVDVEQTVAALSGTVTITDPPFNATPNDATDDRDAIQRALNSGAEKVLVPDGTFMIGSTGTCNLAIPAGVTLYGASRTGAILKQMANTPINTRLIRIGVPCSDSPMTITKNVTIHDLTLDGNKAQQAAAPPGTDTHRAGIFAKAAQNLSVYAVTSRDFTDDGFYFYDRTCMTVTDVLATGNTRDGIVISGGLVAGKDACALAGGMTPVKPSIASSTMMNNGAQQFDSEGGSEDNLLVTGNVIDGTTSNDYAMTVSGQDDGQHSTGWQINHNTINGSVRFVWTSNTRFTDNTVTNSTTKSAIEVQRSNSGLVLRNNTVTQTQTTTDSLAAIALSGTGVGALPSATIIDNTLTVQGRAKAFGILAEGCGTFQAIHNTITGPGLAAPGFAGVNIRATVAGDDFLQAYVHNNLIRNWGAYGVRMVGLVGVPTARILVADITGNTFDDTAGGAMSTAMSLNDDGADAAKDVNVANNTLSNGVTSLMATARVLTGTHTTFTADRWVLPAP